MKRVIVGLALVLSFVQAGKIYATFDVKAVRSANLAFSANGLVKSVNADINDVVKKGDILAELSNDDMKASLKAAEISLKYAKKDYDRQLSVKDVTNQAMLDKFAMRYESTQAQVAIKKAFLDKTILKAPFDGIIVSKNIEVGDSISAARPMVLFQIESVGKNKLILKIDQKYFGTVKKGNIFAYKIDGQKEYKSTKITKVYKTIDPRSRTFGAEAMVDGLASGLFGDGYIESGE